jgi:hypothetical protein
MTKRKTKKTPARRKSRPKLDIKVGPNYTPQPNSGFLGSPDFEPKTITYPSTWWEGLKQTWPQWVFDLLPVAKPELTVLSLYTRVAGHHIAISG